MKNADKSWPWLVQAARPPLGESSDAMPCGFDSRVLAQWHGQAAVNGPLAWHGLLRWAVLCSSVIMLMVLAASLKSPDRMEFHELTVVDSVIRLTLLND